MALVPAAAMLVHQLRYLLAYGGHADQALAEQGHSYLSSITPYVVFLCALALGAFLGRLARAWRLGESDRSSVAGPATFWLACAGGLLAIYIGQELVEGLMASGHPPGLSGVFGDGGWWSVPSAIVVGGLLTLLLRGVSGAINLIARAARSRAPTRPRLDRRSNKPNLAPLPALDPVPRLLAARGPPPLPIS